MGGEVLTPFCVHKPYYESVREAHGYGRGSMMIVF